MFKLEIVRDNSLGKKDNKGVSVSEAISSAYLEYETDIYLHWNDLTLCLNRRGDISEIYNDIVTMLDVLINGMHDFFISFLSSSFTIHWDFKTKK